MTTPEEEHFALGYLLAVANIMNLHGEDVVAEDVLRESGIKRATMEHLGLTDYDLKPLRRLYREIARKAPPSPPRSKG